MESKSKASLGLEGIASFGFTVKGVRIWLTYEKNMLRVAVSNSTDEEVE